MNSVCIIRSKNKHLSTSELQQTASALSTDSTRMASSKLTSRDSWARRMILVLPAGLMVLHASLWTLGLAGTMVSGERDRSGGVSGDDL